MKENESYLWSNLYIVTYCIITPSIRGGGFYIQVQGNQRLDELSYIMSRFSLDGGVYNIRCLKINHNVLIYIGMHLLKELTETMFF